LPPQWWSICAPTRCWIPPRLWQFGLGDGGERLLFEEDNDDPDASQGFKNIKNAPADSTGGQIREGLEQLWSRFEPYADKEFVKEFGRHPEERFWEMYLGNRLLEGRKALRKRSQLLKRERDEGPDFCIQKSRRKIWIEVIAPSPGDEDNLDKVPDLFVSGADIESRRKIELRIASALKTKTDKFTRYREKGIIGQNDSCVVAISASQFALEADAEGDAELPLPVLQSAMTAQAKFTNSV
jgi:hypothetical protein